MFFLLSLENLLKINIMKRATNVILEIYISFTIKNSWGKIILVVFRKSKWSFCICYVQIMRIPNNVSNYGYKFGKYVEIWKFKHWDTFNKNRNLHHTTFVNYFFITRKYYVQANMLINPINHSLDRILKIPTSVKKNTWFVNYDKRWRMTISHANNS